MTVSIPNAIGVPGISGPPIWFSGEPGFNPSLDDVKWRGAIKRTFGSGTAGTNFFRATQATVGPQKFIYLTFRATFVPELSGLQLNDSEDLVYLGLKKHNDASAMVVRIKVHGPMFTPAGPPSANPPASVAAVDIWTLSGTTWNSQGMTPTWINQHARMWLKSSDSAPDPNNRWAVQLRIPANVAGGITDNSGPNLGTDFDMWYLIHGSVDNNPTILADYRTAGMTTQGDLDNNAFPLPAQWDEFQLTSGAATSGGVALYWNDIVVHNPAHGEGTLIENNATNTFIARPRNYSSADIPKNGINASFRIANWGSTNGDPGMPDFSSGSWDWVANSDFAPPKNLFSPIPQLSAGQNPPPKSSPISLTTGMNLPPLKSLHQCLLVTMGGPNLNFLNESVTRNMNFDSASLFEREAEISVVGLTPFAPTPRDVYLAVEKINMAQNTPNANEGQFLEGSMTSLMRDDSQLAGKLKRARSILSDIGQARSESERLQTMVRVLQEVDLTEEELDQLFPTFRVHAYHDTGERVTRNGVTRPVLRQQSSFGVHMYHEGALEGWQTSIEGAQRITDNLYLLPVPNNGTAKVKVRVQAVEQGEQRIPEDPIRPRPTPHTDKKGCLYALLKLFGHK